MTSYAVDAILRREVPTLTPETPIRNAVARLVEARLAAAPVCRDDGGLAGILTQKDCFRPALHASYYQEWTGTVGDFMSTQVVTVEIGEDVIRVAEMFLGCPHRVFPVMDGAAVAGLVHRSDVLAILSRLG